MTDNKKLIEFLDEEIEFYSSGKEPRADLHTQDMVNFLTEIKGIVEKSDKCHICPTMKETLKEGITAFLDEKFCGFCGGKL